MKGKAKLKACTAIINSKKLFGAPITNKNLAIIFLKRGNFFRDRRNYDKAISDYNDAIKLTPKFAKIFHLRGLVYERKHLTDRSIEEFNRVIKLNPKFADAFYDRGRAYDWKEQYLLAIKDYDQAIKLNPKHANAIKHRELTIILKSIDDRKIKRLPKDAEGFLERGQA